MSNVLTFRDAFEDIGEIATEELFAGCDRTAPVLSIVIPTFQRHELLMEALRSALAQDIGRPLEVVVLDDDPVSFELARLIADLPEVASANFRYLRNSANLGYYQNHSRAIQVARGEWFTILHDDDLLDPGFARVMLQQIQADPRIDGLVCRKRSMDCRDVPYEESGFRGVARKIHELLQFGTKGTRRIDARKLFWGCVNGNMVGFMCRTEDACSIGGFYPEEYPSADYFFYARFAQRFTFCESRQTLMTFRVFVNAAIRKETNLAALRKNWELQRAYAGSVLPRFWAKIIPLLMARQIKTTGRFWRNDVTNEEIASDIGVRIPADRPFLLYSIRAALGGL